MAKTVINLLKKTTYSSYLIAPLISFYTPLAGKEILQQTPTVAAVVSCSLQHVAQDLTTSIDLPAPELETCLVNVVNLMLQGNRDSFHELIQQIKTEKDRPLSTEKITALRQSFSQAVKQSTIVQASLHETFFSHDVPAPSSQEGTPLSRKLRTAQKVMGLIKKHSSGKSLLSLFTSTSLSSKAVALGARHLLSPGITIPYSSLLHSIVGAWATTRRGIISREKNDTQEDEKIQSIPLIHSAHILAVEKALKLLYILYSPLSTPCDRMQALFLINHITLLGSAGKAFHSCVARINHSCFSKKGALLQYDPTRSANTDSRFIATLIHLLEKISLTKEQYLYSLQEGISYGIKALQEPYHAALNKKWKQKKESSFVNYSRGIVKEITGYNLSLKKIDPLVVCSTKTNRDFIKLINYCEIDYTQEPARKQLLQLTTAQALIAHYKSSHTNHNCSAYSQMQRYYNDALNRFPHHIKTSLTRKEPA
ncbi:hypothetical protein H0X06_00955 [Candidatus Dependentiae bacterium]|nr:hypothetical protein [Candidatus Dependentiae bacterium]